MFTTNNVLGEKMSDIASTTITLIFGIPGFMIGGWIGLYIAFALASFLSKFNILSKNGLILLITIVVVLISASLGFALSAVFGQWLISKIW
jgi:hypothetical protein